MKKLLLLFFIAASVFISPIVVSKEIPQSNSLITKDVKVYITKTGDKYHKGTCRYLRQSKISIPKKEAISNGYEACKVCKP